MSGAILRLSEVNSAASGLKLRRKKLLKLGKFEINVSFLFFQSLQVFAS